MEHKYSFVSMSNIILDNDDDKASEVRKRVSDIFPIWPWP